MSDSTKSGSVETEILAPDWLNATFIQNALQQGGEEHYKVKEMTIKAATAPGENYASTIYRAKVTLEHGEDRTVVIKVLPPGGMAKMAQEAGFFRSEGIMFVRIVPELEALLNAAAPGRHPPLTARGLHQGTNPSEFIVLEDLRPQGFKTANNHKGLGLRHCLLALRALGRFHAASVALLQKDPSAAEGLSNPFKKTNANLQAVISTGVLGTAQACLTWPGFEEYGGVLNDLQPLLMDKYEKLHEPTPGAFNVILHGDFWTNNMMFRYEDGVPQEVRLVDLQASHVASPALDVLYFLNTSPSENVSIHHQDLLIREYHNALRDTMELLELKAPSLEDLLKDFDSHGSYALFGSMCNVPVVRAPTLPDVEAVLAGDISATTSLYQAPMTKRWLQRAILQYSAKGWLKI